MSDPTLDDLVRDQVPIDEATLAALDLDGAEIELMGEIMELPDNTVSDIETERARSRRRSPLTVVAGLTAAACALAIAFLVGGGDSRPEFTARAVEVAEANPRLLVDRPGWSLVRTAQFTVDDGEMIFSGDGERADGKGELEVHWYPADGYASRLRDRAANAVRDDVAVLDRPAARFRYPALPGETVVTVLPPNGTNFVELRGDLGSVERYMDVLGSVKAVDVETWLAAAEAAKPSPTADEVARASDTPVLPGERAEVVDEMLTGLPLPAGLPTAALRTSDAITNRYDLAMLVSGAVACHWLDRWQAARAAGDRAKADQATRAMASAREWPLFAALSDDERDGYPSVLQDYADAMRDPAAARRSPDVVDMRFYPDALGCREARRGGG